MLKIGDGPNAEIAMQSCRPTFYVSVTTRTTQAGYQEGGDQFDVVSSRLCSPDPVGRDRRPFRFCLD